MTTMSNSTMSKSPILEGKHAVVFGTGGSIGAAVAREFAVEGAEALGRDHFRYRQSGSRTPIRCHRDWRGIWRNRESRRKFGLRS